jgi:hypothetical protein
VSAAESGQQDGTAQDEGRPILYRLRVAEGLDVAVDDACCIVLLGAFERATITSVAEMITALQSAQQWASTADAIFNEFRGERDRALLVIRDMMPTGDEIDDL